MSFADCRQSESTPLQAASPSGSSSPVSHSDCPGPRQLYTNAWRSGRSSCSLAGLVSTAVLVCALVGSVLCVNVSLWRTAHDLSSRVHSLEAALQLQQQPQQQPQPHALLEEFEQQDKQPDNEQQRLRVQLTSVGDEEIHEVTGGTTTRLEVEAESGTELLEPSTSDSEQRDSTHQPRFRRAQRQQRQQAPAADDRIELPGGVVLQRGTLEVRSAPYSNLHINYDKH